MERDGMITRLIRAQTKKNFGRLKHPSKRPSGLVLCSLPEDPYLDLSIGLHTAEYNASHCDTSYSKM